MMDATDTNNSDFVLNFDLLTDDFNLEELNTNAGNNTDITEDIAGLFQSITEGNEPEKDIDSDAFETSKKQHFSVVTDKDLDQLASKNNAISTHWQTNWAVKVLRGKKSITFIQISFKNLTNTNEKIHCLHDVTSSKTSSNAIFKLNTLTVKHNFFLILRLVALEKERPSI